MKASAPPLRVRLVPDPARDRASITRFLREYLAEARERKAQRELRKLSLAATGLPAEQTGTYAQRSLSTATLGIREVQAETEDLLPQEDTSPKGDRAA